MSHSEILGYDTAKSLVVLNKENEWHQRFIAGRDTLSEVVLAHWKKEDDEPD